MDLLKAAINDIHNGNKIAAQHKLANFLKTNPNHEEAWLYLSQVVNEKHRIKQCLQQVLRITPSNKMARQRLGLESNQIKESPPLPSPHIKQTEEFQGTAVEKNSGDSKAHIFITNLYSFLHNALNEVDDWLLPTRLVQRTHNMTGLKVNIILSSFKGFFGIILFLFILLLTGIVLSTPLISLLFISAVLWVIVILIGLKVFQKSQKSEQIRETVIQNLIRKMLMLSG